MPVATTDGSNAVSVAEHALLLAVLVGVVLGVCVGTFSGYYGGLLDLGLMRLIDALLAFPYLLLAIVIVGALGPGLNNAILAIGVSALPTCCRMIARVHSNR